MCEVLADHRASRSVPCGGGIFTGGLKDGILSCYILYIRYETLFTNQHNICRLRIGEAPVASAMFWFMLVVILGIVGASGLPLGGGVRFGHLLQK